MTSVPDPHALGAALRRLAERSYAEEGIPMLLVLEAHGHLVTGLDAGGPELGRALPAAGGLAEAPGPNSLARLIEWLADETFGPSALEGPPAGDRDE